METQASSQPSYDQVALCAYLIWEKEGRPCGREVAHWLQAEKQLLADYHHDNGVLRPPSAATPAKSSRPAKKTKGAVREEILL